MAKRGETTLAAQTESSGTVFGELLDQVITVTSEGPRGYAFSQNTTDALIASVSREPLEIDADADTWLASLDGQLSSAINETLSAILQHPQIAAARAFASDTGRYLAMVNEDHGRDDAFDHELLLLLATRDSILTDYRRANRNIFEMSLYRKLVEQNYGMYGGVPVLLAEFGGSVSGSPADLEFLDVLAQIGRAGNFVWTINAAPSFFGCDTWEELASRTPKQLQASTKSGLMTAYQEWRKKAWARHVCLCIPGVFGTAPFDPEDNPACGVDFTEIVRPGSLVVNSAAAALTFCVTRSMAEWDWPVNIVGESFGGRIDNLFVAKWGNDTREQQTNAVTEMPIPDSMELTLIDGFGVTPLLAKKDNTIACFFGAATTSRAVRGMDPEANADTELHERAPNVLLACRFAHYLKALHRGLIGAGMSAIEVEQFMQVWANQWVLQNPDGSSESSKARRPFQSIVVTVEKVPSMPGYLDATVEFVPHYRVSAIRTKVLIHADPKPRSN